MTVDMTKALFHEYRCYFEIVLLRALDRLLRISSDRSGHNAGMKSGD